MKTVKLLKFISLSILFLSVIISTLSLTKASKNHHKGHLKKKVLPQDGSSNHVKDLINPQATNLLRDPHPLWNGASKRLQTPFTVNMNINFSQNQSAQTSNHLLPIISKDPSHLQLQLIFQEESLPMIYLQEPYQEVNSTFLLEKTSFKSTSQAPRPRESLKFFPIPVNQL